jgi:hypothetical protein
MIAVTYQTRRTPARTRLATWLNSCQNESIAHVPTYAFDCIPLVIRAALVTFLQSPRVVILDPEGDQIA